ncbi:Cerebroside-sulfatase [Planctomycetales bacterium 10988]|nr:Cerebroside-sulfatase [Planctomycetales bacterium 10988]
MQRLNLLFIVGCLTVFGLFSADLKAEDEPAKPNILFILADDLGAGDLGCTGHPYARTPTLDRLAKQGVRFTQAYMSAAWCAPSRYALMRGLYPAREFNQTHLLQADEPSITQLLNEAGYATGHFGKWHLGDKKQHAPPLSAYGIDESFSTQSSSPGFTREEMREPFHRAKKTDLLVDKTIEFIEDHQDEPFYVNLWIAPTHSYIDPTPEQLAKYKGLQVKLEDFENPLQREFLEFVAEHGDIQAAMRAYCADVTAMDDSIGRLLRRLDELGLDHKTMVVFSSDNGPGPLSNGWNQVIRRYKEKPTLLNSVGSAGPFRERKISLYEGGIRLPLIVRYPGHTPQGKVDETTVFAGVDWLPTICGMTGTPLPEAPLDGMDRSAAFLGKTLRKRKALFWSDRPNWAAMRDGNWKAHLKKTTVELYDLSQDPSESTDLSEEYPKVAREMRKELRSFLQNSYQAETEEATTR